MAYEAAEILVGLTDGKYPKSLTSKANEIISRDRYSRASAKSPGLRPVSLLTPANPYRALIIAG